ncbi:MULTISPECIES: nuclear transport factor 2 family protein [Streptomyces]|uniref:Ketosteroid isomerase-like protein n=1 Tax=Streptomyces murinus TaxID=33900 RepID=A0A7W3NIB5_STRMR|nr:MULTISPECIES: nuclear transport factor 2 family protein [Streptomyces]MBA9051066.1 ketosteroid isomerase-like protein [Streptomyces murinus]UWW92496.1 nuclear transport factor 2 family protein [Streptomyces murinus]
MTTTAHDLDAHDLGRCFHAALVSGDWPAIRSMLHDDATWTLPGDNTISGTVVGANAVVERAQKIASYGLSFELLHVLVSRENMALSLHNTARRPDAVLDEYLTTVCRLRDGRIADIETYLSDVPGMNAFFV